MKRSYVILVSVVFIFACASKPSLKNYQARSDDEKRVVEIISEWENAANSYDAQRLYSLYSPKATIQTSTKKGSLKWKIFNREEWFPIIKQRLEESYVASGLRFKFFLPENIRIEKSEAQLIIPYKLSSFEINYLETGLFNFELNMKNSTWTIVKLRYEILTSNHSDWPEYQKWIKKKKIDDGYTYAPIMTEIESKQPPDKPSTKAKIVAPKIPSPRIIAQKWAVIIGISRYQLSSQNGLQNLIFADDDAKVFANVLKKFKWNESHIKLLVNEEATQRNIMIALESWLTKAGPNDQIVLFWAGHGFPDPEDPEKVYFACYDTDINIPVTGYRMDRVRSALEERKARNVVVIADTCHAGKIITRGERGLSIISQVDKMSREKRVPKGWIFMVGADTDRQAIEHTSWTNGAFTHSLIKGLSGEADGYQSMGPKDGTVTMGELRVYMDTAMPEETQRVLGVAKRPVITTSTGDPGIWDLTLKVK